MRTADTAEPVNVPMPVLTICSFQLTLKLIINTTSKVFEFLKYVRTSPTFTYLDSTESQGSLEQCVDDHFYTSTGSRGFSSCIFPTSSSWKEVKVTYGFYSTAKLQKFFHRMKGTLPALAQENFWPKSLFISGPLLFVSQQDFCFQAALGKYN